MYLVPDWCPCDCPRDPHPCSCRRSPPPCPGPHDHRRQASALEGSKQYDFGRGSFGLEQQYLMFLQPAQRLLAGVLHKCVCVGVSLAAAVSHERQSIYFHVLWSAPRRSHLTIPDGS